MPARTVAAVPTRRHGRRRRRGAGAKPVARQARLRSIRHRRLVVAPLLRLRLLAALLAFARLAPLLPFFHSQVLVLLLGPCRVYHRFAIVPVVLVALVAPFLLLLQSLPSSSQQPVAPSIPQLLGHPSDRRPLLVRARQLAPCLQQPRRDKLSDALPIVLEACEAEA